MSKRQVTVYAVSMFLMMISSGYAADQYQWKQVDAQDGCQMYTCPIAGKDYIAAKATCLIHARMEVLATILRDIPGFPVWMHDCKESKVLKTLDDKEDVLIFWLRQHIDLLTDRDMVLKSRTVVDMQNKTLLIYTDSTRDLIYDSGKGYIRMPSFHSLWTLQWVDHGITRVTFMVDPDLGPGVPSGIANSKIKTNPCTTIRNMMKMARQPKYIDAAKTSKYRKIAEKIDKSDYLN